MPRLLFIAERFPPDIGGLASSAGRIAANLCQLGLEVDVLVWSRYLQAGEVLPPAEEGEPQNGEAGDNPPTKNSAFNTPQVYRVGLYRNWDMSMLHTLNVLDWLHQNRQYDAVWGHYLFPAGYLAVWFAELNGLSSTVSIRGNDIDRGIFPPGDFARLLWTLERASAITSVSDNIARKIQVLSHREDVIVLKNAVNNQIFSPTSVGAIDKLSLRESLGITPDEVVLGFAGELREKKGHQFLLNALTIVRSRRPACLLIIGEVRPSQEAALQLYAAVHPEDAQRIIITGHLQQPAVVAQHLQLCDVYLQPSLWEGMPNALLEAMACGCCCIASRVGGIPEVINHGKDGFLLPPGQLHQLGNAVLECLELDSHIKEQICKAARDRILCEFSPQQEKLLLQKVISLLIPKTFHL